MKILISTPNFGSHFRYRVEFQGFLLWHSQNFYRQRQDALNSALSDAWSVLIELNFFTPIALFDLKSGVILAANYAHKCWLGCDSVGRHYNDVLSGLSVNNSQIVPAGTGALGLYEVLGVERASLQDLPMHLRAEYQGLLASLTQDDLHTRIESPNPGTGEGSKPENPNPHQRPQRPNRGDLPRLPHKSGCNQNRSQR